MRLVLAVLLAALALAVPARAHLELGPELQVNTTTAGRQAYATVAGQGDGSFVVVWEGGSRFDFGPPDEPDGDGTGLFLQRFDAAGAPVGGERQVNEFTPGSQKRPDLAARPDGSFVVVWESDCYGYDPGCAPDGLEFAVIARRLDAAGDPLGAETVVNTGGGLQRRAAVAAGADGFVVVWESRSTADPAHDPDGVAMRRFDAAGVPLAGEEQASAGTLGLQERPDVSMDASGEFVVVWTDYYYYNRIEGQRFQADGTPLGEFEVAPGTGNGFTSAVAKAPDGSFVVVRDHYSADYAAGNDVVAQRFDAAGAPLGAPFVVNTHIPGHQYMPAVATDPAGNFVVTWTSYAYPGGQDGDSGGVFGQLFAADGAPLGAEFRVNAFTPGRQFNSEVAATGPGRFVVSWTSMPSYPGEPQDGDGPGVFARRLSLRACTESAECDDANPCTADACEDGRCLGRRQPGCCQSADECWDPDPCTEDVCADNACSNPPIPDCVACFGGHECVAPDACTEGQCDFSVFQCRFERRENCCVDAAECDDGHACTVDACGPTNVCTNAPIAECVECAGDSECANGCLVSPPVCIAGRCEESGAGCPLVTIDSTEPLGAAGRLLVRVEIPPDVPGTGKVKAIVTGRIGSLEAGDTPKRRCRTGEVVGRDRIVIEPGTSANLLLALRKAGARCLAADADGALPLDVTVQVRRKKMPLAELTESRMWRR